MSQVLDQYERTVKPSFTQFILPTKQYAHIIVSPQTPTIHACIFCRTLT